MKNTIILIAAYAVSIYSLAASNPIDLTAKTIKLKPEMVVKFQNGTWACLSRDDLEKLLAHGVKGEVTKGKAMSAVNGGTCTYISPGQKVRLISVEYNNPDIDIALVEIVGEKSHAADGAWALSVGAVPAK